MSNISLEKLMETLKEFDLTYDRALILSSLEMSERTYFEIFSKIVKKITFLQNTELVFQGALSYLGTDVILKEHLPFGVIIARSLAGTVMNIFMFINGKIYKIEDNLELLKKVGEHETVSKHTEDRRY